MRGNVEGITKASIPMRVAKIGTWRLKKTYSHIQIGLGINVGFYIACAHNSVEDFLHMAVVDIIPWGRVETQMALCGLELGFMPYSLPMHLAQHHGVG